MQTDLVETVQEGPPLTEYRLLCPPLQCAYVESNKTLYCCRNRATFGIQIFILVLLTAFLLVYALIDCPNSPSSAWKITTATFVGFFTAMFLLSYFITSYADPGYLPFNWSLTQKSWYHWSELVEGTAVDEDQIQFAKTHSRPRGARFSTSYGRFILRGDHICGCINNWVGLRNHKQFILMNIYSALLAIVLLISTFTTGSSGNTIPWYLIIIKAGVVLLEFCFLLICGGMAIVHIRQTAHGMTQLEKWRGVSNESMDCMDGMRTICGDGTILLWPCPTPAFGHELDLILEDDEDQDQVIAN